MTDLINHILTDRGHLMVWFADGVVMASLDGGESAPVIEHPRGDEIVGALVRSLLATAKELDSALIELGVIEDHD